MILTGSSSAEALIPGSVSAISGALDTVGSSASPARAVGEAWQCMALPDWQGQSATSWQAFVPQETLRMNAAAPAFNRASSALSRYQSAFQSARAETQAAIGEAAAAEQATATALSQHNSAVRAAALAEPGTPEATVAPYRDPGSAGLANARARYATAQATLRTVGDEAAAEIYAAGNGTSNEESGISLWDQIIRFPDQFLWNGLGGQLIDTLVGIWEMLPIQALWEQWFGGKDDAWSEWVDMWGDMIGAIIEDPGAALEAVFREFIAADHWDEYAGEGVGRVVFNIGTLFLGGAGAIKALKGLKGIGGASAAQVRRMPSLLSNSKGVKVEGDRVHVNGADKLSLEELSALYKESIHHMDADRATLGRFVKDSATSYEKVAQENGSAHFNLQGTQWGDAKDAFDLTDAQLYELLNKPFLDDVISKGLPVEFTHNPRLPENKSAIALNKELDYLEENGYMFDPNTLIARK